jgi:predicted transcriptional regulator YdeE
MQLNLGDFEIVGIAVRTTNQNGEAEKDIGALWKRFYAEDALSKIEGKVSEDRPDFRQHRIMTVVFLILLNHNNFLYEFANRF